MFISNRPFTAVAAAIGFALGMVILGGLCEPSAGRDLASLPAQASQAAAHMPVTCVLPEACGIVRAGS